MGTSNRLLAERTGSAQRDATALPQHAAASDRVLARRLFLLLSAVAVVYAFLAGFRTVADPDFFWQLATGRWVAQHHHVFSVDVFSFTAAGNSWVYPAGSGLLFYAMYGLGGYALLSWMGAFACCGAVALLLRRGSPATAALAILAVPLIADRTAPRAEMFTVLLFSAFLSLLWEHYESGHARLWLLPVLMLAWVNLHLGFVSGLAVMAAFAGIDAFEMLRPGALRETAWQRLRGGAPWYAATALATLANPWGWNIYAAILRQGKVMAEHSAWIAEWGHVPLNWAAISGSLSFSSWQPFYLLLAVVLVAAIIAILRGNVGPAILMLCAVYPGIRHLRLAALTTAVIVVLGGFFVSAGIEWVAARIPAVRTRQVLAIAAAAAFMVFGLARSARLSGVDETTRWSYGAGLGWWLPERAADFIVSQKLPAEIYNTYIPGGYLVWKLGPKYRDYFDSRAIPFGPQAFQREAELLQLSPDSPVWQAEADRYNINTIILPIDRFETTLDSIRSFCSSASWRPVYLDEVSAVLVRRTAATEELLRRLQIDCATAPLPEQNSATGAVSEFNHWANAAGVLAALGRNSEALAAADRAQQAYPQSSFVSWVRGNVYYSMGRLPEAEREFLTAVSAKPAMPLYWFSLATVYKHEGKIPETIRAQRKGIDLSSMAQPAELLKLGRLYLDTQQPKAALATFDEAVRNAFPELLAVSGARSFSFQVDEGRAAAWRALGDAKQAAYFDQQAAQDLVPRN